MAEAPYFTRKMTTEKTLPADEDLEKWTKAPEKASKNILIK